MILIIILLFLAGLYVIPYGIIIANEIRFFRLNTLEKAEKHFDINSDLFNECVEELKNHSNIVRLSKDKSFVEIEKNSEIEKNGTVFIAIKGNANIGSLDKLKSHEAIKRNLLSDIVNEDSTIWLYYNRSFGSSNGFIYVESISDLPDKEENYLSKLEMIGENWYYFKGY